MGRSASDVELNLREYAQELVEKAERDGIFNSSGDAALNPATAPMVDRLFEGKYIVGTWRRSPYRPAAFPLALMGSMTSMNVSVGTFDSSGVVWRFTLKVSGDKCVMGTAELARRRLEVHAWRLTSSRRVSAEQNLKVLHPNPIIAASIRPCGAASSRERVVSSLPHHLILLFSHHRWMGSFWRSWSVTSWARSRWV